MRKLPHKRAQEEPGSSSVEIRTEENDISDQSGEAECLPGTRKLSSQSQPNPRSCHINRTRKQVQAFVKNSVPEIKAANPLFTQQQIMATVGARWREQKPMVEESNKAGPSPKRMHQGSASVEMGRTTGDF